MKRIAVIVFLCFGFGSGFSETETEKEALGSQEFFGYKQYLGAAAGFVTGNGISYRNWYSETKAIQITGFPYYSETDGQYSKNREGFLSLGAIHLWQLTHERELRILSYAGGSTTINYDRYRYKNTVQKPSSETSYHMRLGGGIGGELYLWRLSFTLLVGMQAFYQGGSDTGRGIVPTIECGGYFAL